MLERTDKLQLSEDFRKNHGTLSAFDSRHADIEDVVRSRRIAEQHFIYELSNDVDHIMKSMKSYEPMFTSLIVDPKTIDPRFLVKLPGVDENGPGLTRCHTPEEQRAFYLESRKRMNIADAQLFTSVGTDWFAFVHLIVTMRSPSSGDLTDREALGLLPVTPDEETIAGEIGLTFPTYAKQGDAPGAPALERASTLKVHLAWLDGLNSRDPEKMRSAYADGAIATIYNPLDGSVVERGGAQAVASFYEDLFDAYPSVSVDVVMRIIDRWYVFTDLRWQVADRSGSQSWFRTADIAVVNPDNKIVTHLGLGTKPVLLD